MLSYNISTSCLSIISFLTQVLYTILFQWCFYIVTIIINKINNFLTKSQFDDYNITRLIYNIYSWPTGLVMGIKFYNYNTYINKSHVYPRALDLEISQYVHAKAISSVK